MPRRITHVPTGPAAAALLGLDGFRGLEWPPLFAAPHTARPAPGVIRVRDWRPPFAEDGLVVADPLIVLRHLGALGPVRPRFPAGEERLTMAERLELAIEHVLRDELITLDELTTVLGRDRGPGGEAMRAVLAGREDGPPAESYAEVRAIQRLRAVGVRCWRQVVVTEHGRFRHRVDLVVPFDQRAPRPELLCPCHGLLLEIDSREFHEGRFEEDHWRQSTYDTLGYSWTTLTPNQLRDAPARSVQAVECAWATARLAHRAKATHR